ncbi:unnamed protein product [Prorocentrum cordatum]|uniref:Uncharacterized protein n=1 Tax=Prorocentrum cordatum TaxID=2364126 RepID=A0ABN9UCB9_9DINO|nr:unnamed protein product [Polarella glacialis]
MQKLDSVQSRPVPWAAAALLAFTFKLAAAGYDIARDAAAVGYDSARAAAAAQGGQLPVAWRRVALWARRQSRRRTIVRTCRRLKIARLAIFERLRRAGYLGGRVADAARRIAVRAWPRAWPWVRERLRGLRTRLEGTQVLRKLQPGRYQYTYWLFDNVLEKNRWSARP